MENWMNIGKTFEELLRPQTYPLAVKFMKDESEFPERTRRPEQKIAICQALTLSRKFGWTMGITEEDCGCPGASLTYGWTSPVDESSLAQFFQMAGYAADETGTQRIVDNLDRLEPGKYGGVVVSPLTRTKIVPDVILIYGNPAQIMRLLQGRMYKEGEKLKSELAGIMASCTAGIIRTFNTGECQVVVPGNGDRVFAGTNDSELLFTIPATKAEDIIEGMKAQRFAKYPIPVSLQLPPPFPGM
ncbi:MAG: DUF169 domain-containing protein [Candidatus Heimdallarchaeota archaeon]|nr:MAG: DUF169 domain-containing protein [Candidatus Heimdallarchaeota archaeon]